MKHNHGLIILWIVFITSILALSGCTGQKQMASARIDKDGTEMLYGKISRDQLFFDFPEWRNEYDNYSPEENVINELKKADIYDEIFLFLGTWCQDSQREVPRLFKILDQIGTGAEEKIKIWAVDRAKKLADDSTDMYDINFVPTIIFFKNGREIGRIVENPEQRLEDDILNILSNDK